MINCVFTKQVWIWILGRLNLIYILEGLNLKICYANWISHAPEYATMPALVSWNIWLEHNRAFFENGSPTVDSVVYKIFDTFIKPSMTFQFPSSQTNQATIQTGEFVGWFDGVVLSNGTHGGAGGVIKINDKTSIKWTFNCGPGTNTREEFLGSWEALLLATRLHISNLQVLGDSKIIIY